MDSSTIELNGAEVASVTVEDEKVIVHFVKVFIIKSMTGAFQKTRWHQAGDLIFEGAIITAEMPDLPGICSGGDVGENIYTYRDMVPLPLSSRGSAHCSLAFQGTEKKVQIQAESVDLMMLGTARYIEHFSDE